MGLGSEQRILRRKLANTYVKPFSMYNWPKQIFIQNRQNIKNYKKQYFGLEKGMRTAQRLERKMVPEL